MNPWTSGDGHDGTHAAPYRVSLGGLKAFVTRNRLQDQSGLCVDAVTFSSVQLMQQIEQLMKLKSDSLQRVRELEQIEVQIDTAGILLPRQLEAKLEATRSLQGDLEALLAAKSVLLRTLQKSVASEYLDVEMKHQRTFIDLFLKLSEELPRVASTTMATSGASSQPSTTMTADVRQRHKEYEAAVTLCKTTIAKFDLIRDDIARVRTAYSQLEQATTVPDPSAYGG